MPADWGTKTVAAPPVSSADDSASDDWSLPPANGFAKVAAPEQSTAPLEQQEADPEEYQQYVEAVEGEFMSGLMDSKHDVSVRLADKQADINSPLYSARRFEELGLDPDLLKGIYAMKFVKPSKVQERALPLLLADPPQNLVAQSQSGTGKTAAFVVTMLSCVDPTMECTQAVCVAPTRELARQIIDVVRKMGQFTKCTYALLLREEHRPSLTPNSPSTQNAKDGAFADYAAGQGTSGDRSVVKAHILVGTPGTINEYDRKRLLDLSRVKVFVLDEADVMLDRQGMGLQSMRIRKACPETVQIVLFSATFTDSVLQFAHRIAPNANEITLKRNELSVGEIKQFFMDCDSFAHKFEMLSALYGLMTVSQSIIFVATRATADQVQAHMEREGYATNVLHGGHTPEQRDAIIDAFRAGKSKVLISTNVLSRGIDVLPVNLVINFDMPMTPDRRPDPETYLHRIGRTGRFGRAGVSICFVHTRDSSECMLRIQEYFGREIVRLPTESIEHLQAKLQSHLGSDL